MPTQSKNSKLPGKYSPVVELINAWFMAQYANGFPKREFIHERFIITDFTKSKTRYYDLIRLICLLFNCRCLRDEQGVYRDHLYIIGRRNSVRAFIYYLRLLIVRVESDVEDAADYWDIAPQTKYHKSSYKAYTRINKIQDIYRELKTVLKLKKEFYYDKYARIREVRENEVMDNTFFAEYIKEYRLTHLKPFKNAESPTRSTKGETF